MDIQGGNIVSQIKRISDRIFERILSEKNIDAFNGAQGRILYVLWQTSISHCESCPTKPDLQQRRLPA